MKIPLEVRPFSRLYAHPEGHATKPVTMALPYYRSRMGIYTHRVRYGHVHWRHGAVSHISLEMWCGQHGSPGTKGALLARLEDDGVLCATCEGRAIGAGMNGTREINGQPVIFSPRRKHLY